MKWKARKSARVGERRVRSAFLLLPKRIGDETRWLEFSKWEEENLLVPHPDLGWLCPEEKWIPKKWIDDEGR